MKIKYFFHVTHKRISFFITYNGRSNENSSSVWAVTMFYYDCVRMFACVAWINLSSSFYCYNRFLTIFMEDFFLLLIDICSFCVSLFCLLHVICLNVDPLLYTLKHTAIHSYIYVQTCTSTSHYIISQTHYIYKITDTVCSCHTLNKIKNANISDCIAMHKSM